MSATRQFTFDFALPARTVDRLSVGDGPVAAGRLGMHAPIAQALRSYARGGCSCGSHHRGAMAAIDRMEAVGGGVLEVDAPRMWALLTEKFYAGGDLPVLAVREALQNSLDGLAERHRKEPESGFSPSFAVKWEPDDSYEKGTLTMTDNGIGMADRSFRPSKAAPLTPRLRKFLTLGGSQKEGDAFGGFGAAKAVILGAGKEGWRVRTGYVEIRSPSTNPKQQYDVFTSDTFIQGVEVVAYGVPNTYLSTPYTLTSSWVDERIRGMLALNKIPGVSVTLNGAPVEFLYEGQRSSSTSEWESLSWSATDPPSATVDIRMFDAKRGGYASNFNRMILRLRKTTPWGTCYLVQHADKDYNTLNRDIFFDIALARGVAPDSPGYPLRVSRDSFVDPNAMESYSTVRSTLASEEGQKQALAKEKKEKAEWEDILPDAADESERKGAAAVDDAIQEAVSGLSPDMREVMADMARYTNDPAQYAPEEEGAEPPPKPETVFDKATEIASTTTDPADIARVLNALLDATGTAAPPTEVQTILNNLSHGDTPTASDTKAILDLIKDIDTALVQGGLGGGPTGMTQAAAVSALADAVVRVTEPAGQAEVKKARDKINPFGNRAFIRISRKMAPEKVKAFKKNIKRYVPLLACWDSTLRLLTHGARMPQNFQPGFVLEDGTRGMALAVKTDKGMRTYVCVNPLMFDDYQKLYPNRPDLWASYLFNIAAHEIAHVPRLGRGHNDDFSRAREDLGFNAAPALPLIIKMVSKVYKLKPPKSTVDTKTAAELAQTRKELEEYRAKVEKLNRDVLHYRDWFKRDEGAIHTLLQRLDQHEAAQRFADWLAKLGPANWPAGVTETGWGQMVQMLRTNPQVAIEVMLASTRPMPEPIQPDAARTMQEARAIIEGKKPGTPWLEVVRVR